MTDLGDMIVSFKADISNLTSGINEVKEKVSGIASTTEQTSTSFLGHVGHMAGGLLDFGAKIGQTVIGFEGLKHTVDALGSAFIGKAANFQESMTALVTGAGESQKNLDLVSNGILNMAGKVGESTKELSDGMYLIESSGQHGSQALLTLQAAAEGAKVGSASLAEVANGVTTAMTDYAKTGLTATQATNDLIATVASGKTHMGDLANAMSAVLPTAAAAGVSFQGVSAAMATMTGEGTPAADAATYLRQTLMSLENPAAAAETALKKIGLTTGEVAGDMKKSLPDTIQLIEERLAKTYKEGSPQYVAALSDIAGGSRQMQGMLELTGSHLKTFQDNMTGITDAMKKGGDAITGWNMVQGDFNQKLAQAKGAVEGVMISLGEKLLPVAGEVVSGFASMTTALGGALPDAFTYLGNIFQSLNLTDFKEAWKAIGFVIGDLAHQFKGLGEIMGTDADPLAEIIGQLMHAGLDTVTNALWNVSQGFMAIDKAIQGVDLGGILMDVFDVLKTGAGIIQTIEGDIVTFGAGIAEAALKSGALQSVLHTLHDLLPDISAFVKRVGDDVLNNLLPPLKSLIENVGTTVKNFSDWLDKSGTAKMAIGLLGEAVDKTTGFIGKLVEWTSDVVGWLNKGGPAANLVRDAILGIGAAIVAIKLGEFVTNQVVGFVTHAKDAASAVVEWGGKLKDLGGNIMDVAGKIKDSLVAAFDWAKGKIKGDTEDMSKSLDGVKASEEEVGTTAKGEMAKDVETGSKSSEKSLKGVETQASNVEAKETDIGTTAKDTMAKDVGTGAQSSEKSLDGIKTTAEEDVIPAEESIGTTAKTTMAQDVETGSVEAAGPKGLQQIETQATTDVEKEIAIGTTAKTTMATDVEVGSAAAAGEAGLGAISGAAFGVLGILGMISATFMNWQNGIFSDAGTNLSHWILEQFGLDPEGHPLHPSAPPPSGSGNIGTGPRQRGGFAQGGTDIPAGVYTVGERGEETMYVPGHSTIYPHGVSPSAGGGDIHVHNHIYMDGREITGQVMTRAMKEIRRQGVKAA